jgi:hypothetical protein
MGNNYFSFVKIGLIVMFLEGGTDLKAQNQDTSIVQFHDPPIPVEAFFGNNGMYYQTNAKKTFTPYSRFSFFSLATFTADYGNDLFKNRMLIEAQISYSIKAGFGMMIGTDINAVTGFSTITGPQHIYTSRKVLTVTIASFFLNEKRDFKLFGLYEFKPLLRGRWFLYNRVQFIYNHSLKEGVHNRSYIYFRSGLKKEALVFGLGANLDQFGPTKIFEDNFGLFIRWEFR